jgi:tRNA threonylcarbamoyl adenosine modification protein (Sua5/YciO/YrdC/YwlC family)
MEKTQYIIHSNPDHRIIKECCRQLRAGLLVAFPTDTNWQVVASIQSLQGINALYRWKGESKLKHFSLLCSDISQASEYATIDNQAFRLIKNHSPGNFTFILPASKLTTKLLKASKTDHEVGIRIPPCPLNEVLARELGTPLVSTQITPAMMELDTADQIYGLLVEERWPGDIAMVLDPGETEFTGPSTIVSLIDSDAPEIIRQGAGEL